MAPFLDVNFASHWSSVGTRKRLIPGRWTDSQRHSTWLNKSMWRALHAQTTVLRTYGVELHGPTERRAAACHHFDSESR